AGDYQETFFPDKMLAPLALAGRCASLVRLLGASNKPQSVVLADGIAGLDIRGVSLVAPVKGMTTHLAKVSLTRVHIETAASDGIIANGSQLSLDHCLVEPTPGTEPTGFGDGVYAVVGSKVS